MKCLKCNSGNLHPVVIDNVEVDQCDNCYGIWFDVGELSKVLNQNDITVLKQKIDKSTGHDVVTATCPKCGHQYKLVHIELIENSELHIDACPNCFGLWLDGGELEILKANHLTIYDRMKKFMGNK